VLEEKEKKRMSTPDTSIKERIKELAEIFSSPLTPFIINLSTFSLVLLTPEQEKDREAYQKKGLLPMTPQEMAWLVACREHFGENLNVQLILSAKAVLPTEACLGGILLIPGHQGEPYFQWEEHPTIVVCSHPQPPPAKGPTIPISPKEVEELLEAGAGTFTLLEEAKTALPGAEGFYIIREGECRGDITFSWQHFSIHLCKHSQPGQPPSTKLAVDGRIPLATHSLSELARLSSKGKEAALNILKVFPGATLSPAATELTTDPA
jgi:hypothetical protein